MPATLTKPTVDLGEDQWVDIPANWRTYLRLLAERGDKRKPRYIFLDGRLTAVSPGPLHERFRRRLGSFLDVLFESLSIDATLAGSVTLLRDRNSKEGIEADESYYLTNLRVMEEKPKLVMGVDPPPDLVIEVVVSHPEGKAMEVYRRFGVREVWVLKGEGLSFLSLGADGRYESVPFSGLLPFLGRDEFSEWVFKKADEGDTRLRRQFRAWVETTLAPRILQRPGANP